MIRWLLLPTLLSAAACSRTTVSAVSNIDNKKVGLNDVAILLPYNVHPSMIHSAPTISAPGKEFVSAELLKEISNILIDDRKIHVSENFQFGRTGDETFESDVTAIARENPYRLVSLRIDPCVNELQNMEPCETNIRLVFQPLHIENEKIFAKDSNIHAIYKVEPAVAQSIFKLRTSELKDKEALLPHPIIAEEGPDGPYFKGLVTILENNLSPSNLKRVAFFGDTDQANQGHWPMTAFNVEGGKAVRTPLDQLGKQEGEIQKNVQRLHGNHEHLEDPLPRGTIADTVYPVLDIKGDEAPEVMQNMIAEFMTTKFSNSFKLDNPVLHDPATADCASCHVAEIQRFQLAPEMNAMGIPVHEGLGFQSDRWNLQGNVTPEFSRISLQIFSYFRTEAKIAKRAVNDAAHSADILNGDFSVGARPAKSSK